MDSVFPAPLSPLMMIDWFSFRDRISLKALSAVGREGGKRGGRREGRGGKGRGGKGWGGDRRGGKGWGGDGGREGDGRIQARARRERDT